MTNFKTDRTLFLWSAIIVTSLSCNTATKNTQIENNLYNLIPPEVVLKFSESFVTLNKTDCDNFYNLITRINTDTIDYMLFSLPSGTNYPRLGTWVEEYSVGETTVIFGFFTNQTWNNFERDEITQFHDFCGQRMYVTTVNNVIIKQTTYP